MAGRDKEDTRGWSVVLKMIDQPAEEPSVSDQTEHSTLRGNERLPSLEQRPTLEEPERPRPSAREGGSERPGPRPEARTNEGRGREPRTSEPRPRADGDRTVIDKRMASVLSQRPSAPAIEDLDQSIETDGRLLAPEILREPSRPVPLAFADRTELERSEKTELAQAPLLRAFSEPPRPLAGEDTFDDQLLTLTPADRGSSVAPRPKIAGGSPPPSIEVRPAAVEVRPASRAAEPRQVKITPSDPKRASGEVRVTAAPSAGVRGSSGVKITPSVVLPSPPEPELVSPKLPEHLARELGPIEKLRESEMTMLDLAAQIGLAPEPQRAKAEDLEPSAEPRSAGSLPSVKADAAIRMPLPDPGAKVAELLEEDAQDQAVRALNAPLRRGETMLHHLPAWLKATEGAAKIIPVLIMAFVAFATVAVVVTLFMGRGSGASEHVTLKFLPVQRPDGTLTADPNLPAPIVTIETEPAGVLVVLDRKILGPTPLTFELPMRADRVGVELTGPYYETWIGELVREPTGEMHAKVKLTKRR